MKARIVYVLMMGLLLPAAYAKKGKKVDPRLKSIHTIFVNGKDDFRVKDAQDGLERGKCFRLAPNAESADAVMTVLWSSETQAVTASPGGFGGVGGQMPVTDTGKADRSTVILKRKEGSKLKKVWADDIDLSDSEEARKSGIQRLIEKLSQDACAEP